MSGEPLHRYESFPRSRSLHAVESEQNVRERIERLASEYLTQHVIGLGTYARVYSEPAESAGGALCVKDTLRPTRRVEGSEPFDELKLQDEAFTVLEDARRSDPTAALARIPRPRAYAETIVDGQSHHLLVMERIVGKTIFRKLLEAIIQHEERCEDIRGESDTMTDETLETEVLVRFNLRKKPNAREQLRALVDFGKRANFRVPRTTILRTREAVRALHRAGIYHRDLHPKNLMIDDQTEEPYIIDFGKSARVPPNTATEDIYEGLDGETIVKYQPDDEITMFLMEFMYPPPSP